MNRSIAKKLIALCGYLLLILLLVWKQDILLDAMDKGADMPWLVFGLAILFALVPVFPYGLIGAVTGAIYGPVVGGLIVWSASTTAALIMFFFARRLFAEQMSGYLQRHQQIERLTKLFERNSFLAILFARLIPIIPAAVVNIYSGLVRTPLWIFLTATALGKLPTMIVFATVGDQALTSWRNLLVVVAIYAIFLALVYLIYRNAQKKLSR
ncbi:TVP38/TMEM64 family protein [Tumebacillus lipolyticus]|uniref:TVP38/TMEM64 family membrane protein n=1 Tax=Tumebacillus lipolyticus TaxID=1280370 RepID=A0ABW4ZVB2_9BACL